MLQVMTHRNYLIKDADRNQFCFRSFVSQNLTADELVQEILNYNSTITEADARGIMSVLGTLVCRFVSRGYNVELPFGWMHTAAVGSCASLIESFQAGTGDNKIKVIFQLKDDTEKEIVDNAQFVQQGYDSVTDPKVLYLGIVQNDSSENTEDLTIVRGKTIRIHGRYLSFDSTDTRQGVFLGTSDDAARIVECTRAGTNIIDAVIPADTPAGTYKIRVTTKPGVDRYKSDNLETEITVTE